jgi:DUF438 domain-containing protein
MLKSIIKKLHAGESPETVRGDMSRIVRETDHAEIIAMEQELMAEGMPLEEIQGMCDLHSQVTRDVLVQLPPVPVQPGHPLDTMQRENEALREVIAGMRTAITEIAAMPESEVPEQQLLRWRAALNELMDVG